MTGLARGWRLARRSARVLRRHPSLAAFPVLAAITGAVVVALVSAPGVAWAAARDSWWPLVPFAAVAAYAAAFIATYLNVALAFGVSASLDGRDVRLRDGLAGARRRRGAIARWALVQATVGLLLHAVSALISNSPAARLASPIVPRLLGTSWAVATFFVVPLLAFEGVEPRQALRRSARLVRERWGEGVAGGGTIALAVVAAGAIPAAALAALAATLGGVASAALVAIAVLIAIAAAVAGPALSAIFRVVLYRLGDAS